MNASTFWWILTGLMLVAELASGVVYLLMLSLGFVAGAVTAHIGLGWTAQVVVAAVVGALGVLLTWRVRSRRAPALPASASHDLNLDIGEVLHVPEWSADGTARVPYRGSYWTVVLRTGTVPVPGPHRVVELLGNRLMVDRV